MKRSSGSGHDEIMAEEQVSVVIVHIIVVIIVVIVIIVLFSHPADDQKPMVEPGKFCGLVARQSLDSATPLINHRFSSSLSSASSPSSSS